jgi:penicillin G amidase
MRVFPFSLSLIFTAGLIYVLHSKIGQVPALGPLLSPSHGLWQNAEPADAAFDVNFASSQLKDEVNVWLDERLVPHIFATNQVDASFVQGYLHARFRLWQMEFQTHAAAGRICEIIGEKVGDVSVLEVQDRKFRRLGMVYGAERSVKMMEAQPHLKEILDAYTAGVNAYVKSLTPDQFPIEYKILGYAPERWTNLKTALFLKYMSYDLSRDFDDFAMTNLRNHLGREMVEKAFPIMPDSLDPIAPRGTRFLPTVGAPKPPAGVDSLYFDGGSMNEFSDGFAFNLEPRHPDIGSNNWVVGGAKTASGRPILCNDPHLGLNLPSLWYETQIHTPDYNVYGVSFPGAPGIIIGFNDSIAWGVTNAMRDVMDFYEIRFRDSTQNEYLFNGEWVKTEWRTETIKIRGRADFVDKIPMTVWGPVMFDRTYGNEMKNNKAYAVRWSAHDPGMEAQTFLLLNKAKNYDDYLEAIQYFNCPGQNFVFASKTNDIAWWQQANFPAKWRRQGEYVMPGWDSSYAWQYGIPQQDNINMKNPPRGFVSSANQLPADTLYPFFLGGIHDLYRGIIINRYLSGMDSVTAFDMQKMQTDNYNIMAETARPLLLRHLQRGRIDAKGLALLSTFEQWNLRADKDEEGQTVFAEWWATLGRKIWLDEISRPDSFPIVYPQAATLVEALLRDTAFVFVDDIRTPEKETLSDLVTAAFLEAVSKLEANKLGWAAYKATGVRHLVNSLTPFSRLNLPIGGGTNIINAATGNWGPSWRVVVHLTDETEAYGVYPGGQSGNPGSKYYDQFVDQWVKGEYNKLWIMKPVDSEFSKAKWKMSFSPVRS